ncbi:hypothetical protein IWQ61_006773 [Dispira simplex]|nr:hypothetical protein IWQ61_006773 [Dispira simplex]
MDPSELVGRRFIPRQNIPVCQLCLESNQQCDGNVPSCQQCVSVHKLCFFSTRPALKANLNTAAPAGAFMVSSSLVRTELYQESNPIKDPPKELLDSAPESWSLAGTATESVPQDNNGTTASSSRSIRRKRAPRATKKPVIKKTKAQGETRFDYYRMAKQYFESWLLYPMRTSTDNYFQKFFICHEQKRLSYQIIKGNRDLEVARSLAKFTQKDIRYYNQKLSCLSTELPSLTAPESALPPADYQSVDELSDYPDSPPDFESTYDMTKVSTGEIPLPSTMSTEPIFVHGLPDVPRYTILVPENNTIPDVWDVMYGHLLAQSSSSASSTVAGSTSVNTDQENNEESTMDDPLPLPDPDLLHSLHGTAIEFFDRLRSGHMDKTCTPAALLCLGVMMQEYTDYLLHNSEPHGSPPSPVIKLEYDASDRSTDGLDL